MSTGIDIHFYIAPGRLADLAQIAQAAGLVADVRLEEGRDFFVLLDCFDWSVQRSHRVLVKTAGRMEVLGAAGGILAQPACHDTAFVADFEPGPVRDALGDVSPLRALLSVMTGEIRQGEAVFTDDEGKIRLRADMRVFSPGEGGQEVAWIGLRGVRGYDRALQQIREGLRSLGGVGLNEGNIYRELVPGLAVYEPKPVVPVGHDETAFDAACDLIAAYLPVARANEPGIVEDHDTEFVHDYRIALRKIRSVLSLFRGVFDADQTVELKARFGALMEQTGRLRDLDVYLLEQSLFMGLVPARLHGGLERMFQLFREERDREHARLAMSLQTGRYDKEMQALAKLFDRRRKLVAGVNASRGAHGFASALIWKRYRKVCKVAAGLDLETPDAAFHELRIHCKKLRYLIEFFAPVFPGEQVGAILKPMRRLQDALGAFNDYSVQQDRLRAFAEGPVVAQDPGALEIAQSVGALIAVLHQRQQAERAHIIASFARFNGEATQQIFRAVFHGGEETS